MGEKLGESFRGPRTWYVERISCLLYIIVGACQGFYVNFGVVVHDSTHYRTASEYWELVETHSDPNSLASQDIDARVQSETCPLAQRTGNAADGLDLS